MTRGQRCWYLHLDFLSSRILRDEFFLSTELSLGCVVHITTLTSVVVWSQRSCSPQVWREYEMLHFSREEGTESVYAVLSSDAAIPSWNQCSSWSHARELCGFLGTLSLQWEFHCWPCFSHLRFWHSDRVSAGPSGTGKGELGHLGSRWCVSLLLSASLLGCVFLFSWNPDLSHSFQGSSLPSSLCLPLGNNRIVSEKCL